MAFVGGSAAGAIESTTGGSGAAGSTTINLVTGDGVKLGDGSTEPTAPFYILINNEVIKVTATATNGDALTVVRGQAGTTDVTHNDGDTVEFLTAGVFGGGAHPDILSNVKQTVPADHNPTSAAAAASATPPPASASASRATWATTARRRPRSSRACGT